MARNRASARDAGSRTERLAAEYIADAMDDDRIERRVRNGTKDRGDIGGVRTSSGERVVIEVKDTSRLALGSWVSEMQVEKSNDGAPVGVVIHKRVGYGEKKIGGWYVTTTLDDFIALLGGHSGGTE